MHSAFLVIGMTRAVRCARDTVLVLDRGMKRYDVLQAPLCLKVLGYQVVLRLRITVIHGGNLMNRISEIQITLFYQRVPLVEHRLISFVVPAAPPPCVGEGAQGSEISPSGRLHNECRVP